MATQLQEQEAPEHDIGAIAVEEGQSAPRDYEGEARERGWVPKEEFKGDPARHIDAQSFIERTETVMPLLKKENGQLKSKIEFLERQVKKLTKAEQRAYDSALADLKARQKEAVEYGDVQSFEKVDQQIEALRADMEADTRDAPENPAVAFAEFKEANEWYGLGQKASATDLERRASDYADTLAEKYQAQGLQLQMTPSEFFGKIADEVRGKYPTLSEEAKPARQKPGVDVAGVTRPGGARNMKTAANLPADAKLQAKRFFETGVIKAKDLAEATEKYARSYQWDN